MRSNSKHLIKIPLNMCWIVWFELDWHTVLEQDLFKLTELGKEHAKFLVGKSQEITNDQSKRRPDYLILWLALGWDLNGHFYCLSRVAQCSPTILVIYKQITIIAGYEPMQKPVVWCLFEISTAMILLVDRTIRLRGENCKLFLLSFIFYFVY